MAIAVLQTLYYALSIYWWIVILAAVFSWLYAFNVINSRNQFVSAIGNALYQLTEPVFSRIRRFMPDLGGIDISPILVLLAIFFLQQLLVQAMYSV